MTNKAEETNYPVTDWNNLYGEPWGKEIVPEAVAHPAKFSRALIRQIYQHMIASGWLKSGDAVGDPFGGVANGALDAMVNGCHWIGVELEASFTQMGQGYDCPGVNAQSIHPLCPKCKAAIAARNATPEDSPLPPELPEPLPHRYHGNIETWNGRYSNFMPMWGSAILINGDSQNFSQLIRDALDTAVTSPPFIGVIAAENVTVGRRGLARKLGESDSSNISPIEMERIGKRSQEYGRAEGQLGGMGEGDLEAVVTSPPFAEGSTRNRSSVSGGDVADVMARAYTVDNQGVDGRNLSSLKASDGDLEAAVSSPPYANVNLAAENKDVAMKRLQEKEARGELTGEYSRLAKQGCFSPNSQNSQAGGYGRTEGQLGVMREGHLEAAVSSPPYVDAVKKGDGPGVRHDSKHHSSENSDKNSSQSSYGKTAGNIGNASPDTFWQASKEILEELYMSLKPGGVAAFVCKDYVRGGKRVPFSSNWQRLAESVGFETIEWVMAWQSKNEYQVDTSGNSSSKSTKGFFRGLIEANAAAKEYWFDADRETSALYLWSSRRTLWDAYNEKISPPVIPSAPYNPTWLEMGEYLEKLSLYKAKVFYFSEIVAGRSNPPKPPTRSKIRKAAAMDFWDANGRPSVEIEARIDNEDVVFMRKPGGS